MGDGPEWMTIIAGEYMVASTSFATTTLMLKLAERARKRQVHGE